MNKREKSYNIFQNRSLRSIFVRQSTLELAALLLFLNQFVVILSLALWMESVHSITKISRKGVSKFKCLIGGQVTFIAIPSHSLLAGVTYLLVHLLGARHLTYT
jgi:hypothetical protein